jgi:hypothetical protein
MHTSPDLSSPQHHKPLDARITPSRLLHYSSTLHTRLRNNNPHPVLRSCADPNHALLCRCIATLQALDEPNCSHRMVYDGVLWQEKWILLAEICLVLSIDLAVCRAAKSCKELFRDLSNRTLGLSMCVCAYCELSWRPNLEQG